MIFPTLARLIVRELLYKPISGKVLCLGRQRIGMTYREVMELLEQEGFTPSAESADKAAAGRDQRTRGGKGTDFISDDAFFGLLGVNELLAMDVSPYEGADIVHNLNLPVPESLHGQFDFIIDGGTFDHFFDVRVAFENVVKLLRPGGRVLQWNAASNQTGSAYLSFGPDLCYDYYVLNQFADCKVYVAEMDHGGQGELWDFYQFEGADHYSGFPSPRIQLSVVLAEKGQSSTWDRMPVQAKYRDEHLWAPYRQGQKLISTSGRRPLTGSKTGLSLSTRWTYKRAKIPPSVRVKLMVSKVREKGPLWCTRRAAAKSSARLFKYLKAPYHLVKPPRRSFSGKELVGYKYLGKI